MTRIVKPEEENVKILINHLLKFTCRLVKLSEDKSRIDKHCSGFLLKIKDKTFLISACHAFEDSEWLMEANVLVKGKQLTILIPVKNRFELNPISFRDKATKPEWIDFAWAEIDLENFSKSIESDPKLKGQKFEFLSYQCFLDQKPVLENVPYTYASWNRNLYLRTSRANYRQMDYSYEILMTYKGIESVSGHYIFSLARHHQGHDYYNGASGSPIVDPEGKIVSILLEGDEKKHVLYGLPLADFAEAISITY